MIASGPFTALEAKEKGLIDEFIYEIDLEKAVRKIMQSRVRVGTSSANESRNESPLDLFRCESYYWRRQDERSRIEALMELRTWWRCLWNPFAKSASWSCSSPSTAMCSQRRRAVEALAAEMRAEQRKKVHLHPEIVDPCAETGSPQTPLSQRVQEVVPQPSHSKYPTELGRPPKIAIVLCEGLVARGRKQAQSPRLGLGMCFSGDIMQALTDARADPFVAVVVLRVNSGGGDYIAADAIRHAVEQLKAAGKAVVCSFGDTGASGGYLLGSGADYILASPASITGSLGVFTGKIVVGPALRTQFGVNFDSVDVGGSNADMSSPLRPFSDRESEWIGKRLETVYTGMPA